MDSINSINSIPLFLLVEAQFLIDLVAAPKAERMPQARRFFGDQRLG